MTHLDPVCGMTIDEVDAVGTHQHDGVTYFFCNPSCLERFQNNPQEFLDPVITGAPRRRRERPSSVRWTPRYVRRSLGPARSAAWRSSRTSEPGHSGEVEYTCPMHPQIVRDAPGSCPIAGWPSNPAP